jgi:ficolin
MDTDGGGWTVFQKRDDFVPGEDFYRTWLEYKRGFGNLQKEFWLGNDRLSMLTNQDLYQLRVDLADFDGQKRFAIYDSVRIANEVDKYRLTLGSYIRGDAGNSLSRHNGMRFSTKDQDNDIQATVSCAQAHKGAWWYDMCHDSNLNGLYLRGDHPTAYAAGVNWWAFRGYYYSLKTAEMKIRPVWFKP